MVPEFGRLRRQDRLSDMNQLAHEPFRFRTKRKIDASLRAEHVGDDRIATALHALKQQGRSTFADDASMDLGELEVWINLGFDGDDFVFSVEYIEKCAQARMHLVLCALYLVLRPLLNKVQSTKYEVQLKAYRRSVVVFSL